jgi:two-component system, cell cycle sensor histidine kinase and response regulator CckA
MLVLDQGPIYSFQRDIPVLTCHPMPDAIRILLIEDSPEDAALIAKALHRAGLPRFDLKTVDNLRDLRAELETKPALILSDFNLPGLSALTVLDELRNLNVDTPVILVTGSLTDEVANLCLEHGAVDYILKDRLGRLDTAIKRALTERNLRSERTTAVAALRESEERFRQIAENIDEAVWLTDVHTGRVIYVNPAYEKIWNRSPETLYSDPDAWLDALHPDDGTQISPAARQTRDVEYRILLADGAIRWVYDRALPVENGQGQIYRMVRIAEDVTQRRLLEDQLRHAQKMEAIGQFAGSVAHDFNNILTVIMGHSQLGLERLPPEDPVRRHLLQIRNAAFRAASLTRQLLAFSRKQILRPHPININAVVTNVEGMVNRLVGADIQLNVDLDPNLETVKADPGQIEQVILNLLGNARDAMPEGGMIRIETRNMTLDEEQGRMHDDASPGRYVMLTVTDTGIGMDQATLAQVFEPFFTTKAPGKGTGLGLATVYGIVKQSGGFISLASTPGVGTTVTIYLPAIAETPDGSSVPEGGETIVLVESDDAARKWIRDVLGGAGYTVREAHDLDEALRLAETQEFSRLILADVDAIVSDLRDRIARSHPELKVLYMSMDPDEPSGAAGAQESEVHFIPKPFSRDRLLQRIREILDSPGKN